MKRNLLRRIVRNRLSEGMSRQQIFDELAEKYPGSYETLLELLKYQMTLSGRKKYGRLLRLLQLWMLSYTGFTIYLALENPQWEVGQYLMMVLVVSVQWIAIYGIHTQPLRTLFLFCLAAVYGPYHATKIPELWLYYDYGSRIAFIALPLLIYFKNVGRYKRTKKIEVEGGASRTLEWAQFD